MAVQDAERWGGRYALSQSKLYIVVHDICGEGLASAAAQRCLATLAACESVALLATVESLNSVAHWDRRMLANFHWSYLHAPTYKYSRIPADFPLRAAEGEEEAAEAAAAEEDDQQQPRVLANEEDHLAGAAAFNKEQVQLVQSVPIVATGSSLSSTATAASAMGGAQVGAQPKRTAQSTSVATIPAPVIADVVKNSSKAAASTNSSSSSSASAPVFSAATIALDKGMEAAVKSAAAKGRLTHQMATVAARALAAIRKSLTANHNSIMEVLVKALRKKHQQQEQQAKDATAAAAEGSRVRGGAGTAGASSSSFSAASSVAQRGLAVEELLAKLGGMMLAKSQGDLKHLLKEFIDHAVVALLFHGNKEYVCLKPPYDALLLS